jgi:hypothetical protein
MTTNKIKNNSIVIHPLFIFFILLVLYHYSSLIIGYNEVFAERFNRIFPQIYDIKYINFAFEVITISYFSFVFGYFSYVLFPKIQIHTIKKLPIRYKPQLYNFILILSFLVFILLIFIFKEKFFQYSISAKVGDSSIATSFKTAIDFILITLITIFYILYIKTKEKRFLMLLFFGFFIEFLFMSSGSRKPFFLQVISLTIVYLNYNKFSFKLIILFLLLLFLMTLIYSFRGNLDDLSLLSNLNETLFSHLVFMNSIDIYFNYNIEMSYQYLLTPVLALIPRILMPDKNMILEHNAMDLYRELPNVGGQNIFGNLLLAYDTFMIYIVFFIFGFIAAYLYKKFINETNFIYPLFVIYCLFMPLTYGYVFSIKIFLEFVLIPYFIFTHKFIFKGKK